MLKLSGTLLAPLGAILFFSVGCSSSAPASPNVPGSPDSILHPNCAEHQIQPPDGVVPGKNLHRVMPKPPISEPVRSGYACIQATINTSGRVTDAVVVEASNQRFARAFLEALAQWRFEPATRNGAPVELRTSLSASFDRQ